MFTFRNALITVVISLIFFFNDGVKLVQGQVEVMEHNIGSIVTDYKFSDTRYYLILEGFFDGMQFSRSFNDAEQCEIFIKNFLDDFFIL